MDVISQLLRNSMLTALGDNEDRVGRVRGAVDYLATSLRGEARTLVPNALISSCSVSSSATEDVLVRAEQALMTQWETYRNAFAESPVQLLRAVALAALVAATEDAALAGAAWYTSRTALTSLDPGPWAGLVSELAAKWAETAASSALTYWSAPLSSTSLRMPDIPAVDSERLAVETKLREQVGNIPVGNWNSWVSELMPKYPDHVSKLINIAEVAGGAARKQANAQLRDFAGELGRRLRAALLAHDQEVQATSLRARLLWWRLSGYSDRLDTAYSALPAPAVALAAALDLHAAIPQVAPASVEHLLAALVAEATGDAEVSLDALSKSEQAAALPAATDVQPATIAAAVQSGAETPLLGRSDLLPASRSAVFVFRDLQALRLAATPPPTMSDTVE